MINVFSNLSKVVILLSCATYISCKDRKTGDHIINTKLGEITLPNKEAENNFNKGLFYVRQLEQQSPYERVLPGKYTMGNFVGSLAPDRAHALLKHVEQNRKEWDRNF